MIDWEDVRERSCPVCGAFVADAVTHRRWHRTDAEISDAMTNVLRGLVEQIAADDGIVL